MDLFKIFNQIKATITVIIERNLIESYTKHLGKIMTQELLTVQAILRNPAVLKLGMDLYQVFENNKEAITSISNEFKLFMARCENMDLEDDAWKDAGIEIGSIWGITPSPKPSTEEEPVFEPEERKYNEEFIFIKDGEKNEELVDLAVIVNNTRVDYPERKGSIGEINRWITNGKFRLAIHEMKSIIESQDNLRA
jgi:hypothetical protein